MFVEKEKKNERKMNERGWAFHAANVSFLFFCRNFFKKKRNKPLLDLTLCIFSNFFHFIYHARPFTANIFSISCYSMTLLPKPCHIIDDSSKENTRNMNQNVSLFITKFSYFYSVTDIYQIYIIFRNFMNSQAVTATIAAIATMWFTTKP